MSFKNKINKLTFYEQEKIYCDRCGGLIVGGYMYAVDTKAIGINGGVLYDNREFRFCADCSLTDDTKFHKWLAEHDYKWITFKEELTA
jgi:hypothetical protein